MTNYTYMKLTGDEYLVGEPMVASLTYRMLVSNDGKRFWNPDTGKFHKVSRRCNYLAIHLRGRSVRCHYIVADAFHGPRPKGLTIDHINRKKHDNRPENLKYITQSEQTINVKQKRFTAEEDAYMRERRAAGDSYLKIADALGRAGSTVSVRYRQLSGKPQIRGTGVKAADRTYGLPKDLH
jgi:hypothetical protein